jgi:hypothetical protein
MQLTEVLWIHPPVGRAPSAAQLTLVAAQHHDVTLLAMLLGGLIALMGTIAVTDPHPRGQALTVLLMPIPLLVAMALSIQLVTHRSAGIVVLAVVLGVGTYVRKFAPRFSSRVVLYGVLLFVGYRHPPPVGSRPARANLAGVPCSGPHGHRGGSRAIRHCSTARSGISAPAPPAGEA